MKAVRYAARPSLTAAPRDLFFSHKLCLSFAMARW